jgi:hypothetical protein
MSEQKTIYCGGGKKQKEEWRKISVCLTDLPKEHIFEYNGKKYIKLNINDKQETDQYGKDVSVSVDTWKPEEVNKQNINKLAKAIDADEDLLPF